MQEQTTEFESLKQKTAKGVAALTSRTFILQVVALVATFVLTVLLDPATFGIFYIVTAIVNFLNYFSDIGLAAALIQSHADPCDADYSTTFTLQQLLVITAVSVAFLLSGPIGNLYGFGSSGVFLFRALCLSFFLSSLKTIPSVMLERKLDFNRLVIPQVVETSLFYLTAIVLAYMGYGVLSFAWAAIIRGVSGTALLYMLAPWKPAFHINRASAKRLLSFGLPFQANSFMALIKDDLLTAFLGTILPFAAIGYIGWAKKWAEIALRLLMDNVIKVTFPAFARLQYSKELLSKAVNRSLEFLAILSLPIAIGMMVTIGPFIDVIPRYEKWEPALFSFYLFTISSILAALSSPLVNALNALGKVRYTFFLMLFWTVITWMFVPLSVNYFGFNGVAIAAVLIGLTSFLPIVLLRKHIDLNLVKLVKPLFFSFIMALVLLVLKTLITSSVTELVILVISGIVVYSGLLYVFMKKDLAPYVALVTKSVFKI